MATGWLSIDLPAKPCNENQPVRFIIKIKPKSQRALRAGFFTGKNAKKSNGFLGFWPVVSYFCRNLSA
jgi:hypothetical protein